MSTALDWIGGESGRGFEHGEEFVRLRAVLVRDPYSGKEIGADWSRPDEADLVGAYFSSQGSTDGDDPVRRQTSTRLQLIIPDPGADVRRGDRIRRGDRTWSVVGFPEADTNPWTGWRPSLVVDLEDYQG